VIFGFLSAVFHHPAQEMLDQLRSNDEKAALQEAATLLSRQEAGFRERAAELLQSLESVSLTQWLSAHEALFGHTARGSACPYESEYGQSGLFEQPRHLSQIMGFYNAFGLTTGDLERERPDHISCELEFLGFLSRKEAVALELRDDAMLSEIRRAITLFLKNHVGRFGRAFARAVCEQDSQGLHSSAAGVLLEILEMECRRVGVPVGPQALMLRPAEEDGVPMACGDQSELVQLQVPE
jgi:TorA maturation chaperone TorD